MRSLECYLALVIVGVMATWAWAGDCCQHCGCQCQVRKVCHLKCEVKKVPHVTYSCKCEDFCVPGPSKKCGYTCEADCHGCEKCKPNFVPQCGTVHTKKKLYKHTEMKEERVYKWVVEYVCDNCAKNCPGAQQANDAQGPACSATSGEENLEPAHVPVPPMPTTAKASSNFLEGLFAR